MADLNGDESLDILVHTASAFHVLTNATVASPSPSAPLSPTAISKPPQGAEFRWLAPEGSEGFSYNIRIGTKPRDVDIVSPHSDLTTGTRRIVEMGNAGQSGTFQISGLMPGTYFWSVQSIDQAYRGSKFTEEAAFTHVTAPLIRDLVVTNVTGMGARISASINPGGLPVTFWIHYGTNLLNQSSTARITLHASESYVSISENLTGLSPQNAYFFTLVLSNRLGINQSLGSFTTELFAIHRYSTETTNGLGRQLMFVPGVFAANFNNDDKMDFIAADAGLLGLNVFENLGSRFQRGSALWSNIHGGIRLLDWNNDGALDIMGIQTSGTGSLMRLAIGDGQMGFADADPGLPLSLQVYWTPPALADLDLDGLRDLVVVCDHDGEYGLFVFWGTEAGFDPNGLRLSDLRLFLIADIDNNGYPDIFANSHLFEPDLIFINRGQGSFTTIPWDDRAYGAAQTLGVVDLDMDGRIELSFSSMLDNAWFLKNEVGEEPVPELLTQGIEPRSWDWGDYNQDGAPDFLGYRGAAWVTGAARGIFKNFGGSSFRHVPVFGSAIWGPNDSHWLDADSDGDLDIVIMEQWTNNLYVLENRTAPTPFPLPPKDLRAEVKGTGVRLGWSAPESSPEHACSYNVRVGTEKGRSDVVSALVAPGTSKPLLHQMGNAQLRKFAILTNLPAGNYYWSVQAVDWAYRGSRFTTEESFTIQPDEGPLQISLTSGSPRHIAITGQRGRKFVVESSQDLLAWQPEMTNSLLRWRIEIPLLAEAEKTFFRVRTGGIE